MSGRFLQAAQKRRNMIAEMITCSKSPVPFSEIRKAVVKAGLGTSGIPDRYSRDSLSEDLYALRRDRNMEIRYFVNVGYISKPDYVQPPSLGKARQAYKYKPEPEPEKQVAIREPDTLPGKSLSEVTAEARKLGLSYGQYLVKIKTEKEGWNHGK